MVSKAGRYGINIGTGAASGAALGTSILPGWGTAIGGVLGAGAGAISAAVQNSDADDEQAAFDQDQARERKLLAIKLLRAQMIKYGQDTSGIDAQLALKGVDLAQGEQRERFNQSREIDPNAFVGMATQGAKAAAGIYKAANQPSMSQPTSMPELPSLENPGAYQLDQPRLLQGDEYALDPNRYRLTGGFR